MFSNCSLVGKLNLVTTHFVNLDHCLPKHVSFDIQMASIWNEKGLVSIWKSLNQQTTNIGYVCFYAHDLLHILFAVNDSKFNKVDFEWHNLQDFKSGHETNKCFTKFSNPRKKEHIHNTEKSVSLCNTKKLMSVQDFLTSYQSDCFQLWKKFAAQNGRLITIFGKSIGDNFENNGKILTDSSIKVLLNCGHKHTCVHLPCVHMKKSSKLLQWYICDIRSGDLHTILNLNQGFIQRKRNVCILPLSLKQVDDPGGGQHVIEITSKIKQKPIPNCVRSSMIYMFSLICVLAYESLRRNDNINRTKEISEKLFSFFYRKPSITKTKKDQRILQSLLELKTIKVFQDITTYPVSRLSLNNILDKESSGSLSKSRMINELMRLSTLSNFPVHGISLIRLAENGFFSEGNGDELVCYSCGIRLKGWSTDCNPGDIHQKYSPNCLHILEKKFDQAELPESRNSTATDGRKEGNHANVSNGDITCEQIMCTDARHEDSFNSLLITTSQNAARFPSNMQGSTSNNTASTFLSQQSERISKNMTHNVLSSMSLTEIQSNIQQYPSSNNSNNYFTEGYRLANSGYGREHTLSCNPCSDTISSNWPRSSIGSMNCRTPTRTSFLERQLSMDGEPNTNHNLNHLSLMPEEQRLLSIDTNEHQDTELYLPSPPILQRLPDTFDQNVPYTCSDEKISTGSTSHRPTRPSSLKYPNYESSQSRKDSYFDWPANRSSLHPYDLSECGLFFTHFEDCVRCFQCGIGLRNWEEDDNPWVEHARWSRKCQYLIRRKGQGFIDSVVQLLGLETDEEITHSLAPQPNREEITTIRRNPLEHTAAIYVMSEGIFDDKQLVLECMASLLDTNNWHSITTDLLVTSILEKNETTPSGSSSGPDIATDKVNTSWNSVIKNDQNDLLDRPEITLPTKDLKPIDMDIERKSKADDDPGTLQKENEELEDLYTCKICLDEKVGVTFLPCGHLVTCKSCSPKLRKCPLCRKFIRSTITTKI
ncbi:BIRC2_3 [Mytilus coruscus]|uniref:BIRC2_3 n=1 Tax=Mytilus coruscus TaxID=42192 RepID=A0A6J8B5F5_MYTCO|nr:BIRC2_3 [Mytilus coruscus]